MHPLARSAGRLSKVASNLGNTALKTQGSKAAPRAQAVQKNTLDTCKVTKSQTAVDNQDPPKNHTSQTPLATKTPQKNHTGQTPQAWLAQTAPKKSHNPKITQPKPGQKSHASHLALQLMMGTRAIAWSKRAWTTTSWTLKDASKHEQCNWQRHEACMWHSSLGLYKATCCNASPRWRGEETGEAT